MSSIGGSPPRDLPVRPAAPARRLPTRAGSLVPQDYTPVYEGGEVTVTLPSDYYGAWQNLKAIDDDSMFDRVSYNIPNDVTRSWGVESIRSGEGHKTLYGPVTFVNLTIGYQVHMNSDNINIMGAPDNAEAMRVAAHAFTKDIMAAMNGVIGKYNGAVAGAASESKIPRHVELRVSDTVRDCPANKTRQRHVNHLKFPIDLTEAVVHCDRHGCAAEVSLKHRGNCSAKGEGNYTEASSEDLPVKSAKKA